MTTNNSHTRLSQSDIAIQIERLVKGIEQHDTPAFRFRGGRSQQERIEDTRLTRHFDHIQQMVDLFDDRCDYSYSEHLQAFWNACQDIGIVRGLQGPVCLNEQGTSYLDHHRSMNVLVARIRQLISQLWYRRKKGDLRSQARDSERAVIKYTDAILERYSRTIIVRVDLYYRSAAQARLRVEHVFDDLDQLVGVRKQNPIFDHEIGYICSVEQGEGRGFHIHAAFFFKGDEVRGDIHKAQQIGELWERITRGQGCFNSCNHNKESYGDMLGIGLIKRSDHEARRQVHYVMRYLVKDDQQVLVKPLRAKCLRKGLAR
ncbi:YagK/YfjJ domain-containing protein [Pseudomonas guineae]|uniref:YagK/YfjJ domain-containing protein n=1 Tax=Pseudomonas guineae TaxID=425504 RepID=UPI003D091B69